MTQEGPPGRRPLIPRPCRLPCSALTPDISTSVRMSLLAPFPGSVLIRGKTGCHSRDSTCVGLEAQATRVTKTGSSLCAGGRCTEGQGLQHSAIDRVPGGSSRNAGRPSGLRLLVSASQARLGEARLSREGRTSLNPLFFLRIFSRDRKIRLRGPFPVFR